MYKVLYIILSGGNGSRLRPLTLWRQKTLLPVRPGRVILDYAINQLGQSTPFITQANAVVLARYKADQVRHHVVRHHPTVRVLIERQSLDTGGALLQHWDVLAKYAPDVVVVLNGDHVVDLPMHAILSTFRKQGAPGVMFIGTPSVAMHHQYLRLEDAVPLHPFSESCSQIAYTGMCIFRFDALAKRMATLPMGTYNLTTDIVNWVYANYGGTVYVLNRTWDDLGTWGRYLGFLLNRVGSMPMARAHT